MSVAESFARTGFAKFINTGVGRVVRVVAGLALIALGWTQRDAGWGPLVMLLGVAPLAAGTFNWCLISALLGGPLDGNKVAGRDP